MNEDLIEYIDVCIPGVGNYKVDVIYRTLPDACFGCKRGHIAQYCPLRSNKEKTREKGNKGQGGNGTRGHKKHKEDTDGFQIVGNPIRQQHEKGDEANMKEENRAAPSNLYISLEGLEEGEFAEQKTAKENNTK